MHDEIYRLILQGEPRLALERLAELDDDPGNACFRALAFARLGEAESARVQLQAAASVNNIDARAQSACLEARMLLESGRSHGQEQIAELARRAIDRFAGAVFAHRLLGRLAEASRGFEAAAEHYRRALETYPGSRRTALDLARTLMVLRRPGEALAHIRQAPRSLRREVYRLAAYMRSRAGLPLIVVLAILLLNNLTGPVAFWIVASAAAAGIILALRWADGLVLLTAVLLGLVALVFGGLRVGLALFLGS